MNEGRGDGLRSGDEMGQSRMRRRGTAVRCRSGGTGLGSRPRADANLIRFLDVAALAAPSSLLWSVSFLSAILFRDKRAKALAAYGSGKIGKGSGNVIFQIATATFRQCKQILACKEMRIHLNILSQNSKMDGDEGSGTTSAFLMAKVRVVTQDAKNHFQILVLIFIELKLLLESKNSPLIWCLMECLCAQGLQERGHSFVIAEDVFLLCIINELTAHVQWLASVFCSPL